MKTLVSTAGTGQPGVAETSDVLAPGAMAGPWRVEHELGRGGMGAVYAVIHDEIGKRAALKVVHRRLMPSFNCDRMLLEAKVVNQVGHPNIVDIFETGKLADDRPYIVMERLTGRALSARADEGKLLPDQVIAIMLQVCDALIAAHAAGIVHRDLKLDNVFLTDNPDDPTTPRVKLLDWGIAKVIHHEVHHTIEGQLMGTPQYLSPEQARGQMVSPQTDVYSLGVMAYELFLEQLPFEAETAAEVMAMHLRATPPPPRELWPDIPRELEQLLLAMLAKSPDQRPTASEVAAQLEAVRSELERRCRKRSGLRLPAIVAPVARPVSRSGRPASRPGRRASRSGRSGQPGHAGQAGQAARMSSQGLLATELVGWRSEARRWQYAIGGLALALSALMFWISRDRDRSAIAATVPDEVVAPAATGAIAQVPTPVEPDRVSEPHQPSEGAEPAAVPATEPGEPAAPDESGEAVATAATGATDRAERTGPAVAVAGARGPGVVRPAAAAPQPLRPLHADRERIVRPAPHPAAPRITPVHSSALAAPRPSEKLDPDGTLAVYR